MNLEDGYPTEEELGNIKAWDMGDLHGLMEYIMDYWKIWGSFSREGDIYTLATGGWSGNEDIIGAMQENIMFWALYWYSSSRGGKHVFAPCTRENIARLA